MDVAKSLFGNRDHEGYVGKDEHMVGFLVFVVIWNLENFNVFCFV